MARLAQAHPGMPELTAQHGYLAVCIISVVCIIVELVIFKWKKWL